MSIPKKLLGLFIIATFLASIPLAFAQSQPEYKVVISEIRVKDNSFDDNFVGKPGGGVKPVATDYLLLGIKWSTAMFPLKVYVKEENGLLAAVGAGASQWDGNTKANIFGSIVSSGADFVIETSQPDYKNEIVFGGRIDNDPRIIGVTYTWYNFRSQIVQFDMILNAVDYTWGDAESLSPDVMDTQNIVTHELGHGLGLADLYDTNRNYNPSTWPLQTMWGFGDYNEISKRDLANGDIAGIQKLYGA
jgi:hypothetical protein